MGDSLPVVDEAGAGSVQLAYGQASDGRMAHIGAVPQGLACGCVCPACGTWLVARKGAVRVAHFAHHSDHACATAYETMLHRMAKQVIADRLQVGLPAVVSEVGDARRPLHKAMMLTLDAVTLEPWLGAIRPDIMARKGDKTLLVEIRVTSACTPEKLALLAYKQQAAIEIDLRRLPRHLDGEALAAAVIQEAPRTWLWNAKAAEANALALDQAERERARIEAGMEAAAEAKAAELRETAAMPFDPVDGPSRRDNGLRASIQVVERAGLSNLVGLPIEGDQCFRVPPVAWQSALASTLFPRSTAWPGYANWPGSPSTLLAWLDRQEMVKRAFLAGGDERLPPEWAGVWDRLPGLRPPLAVLGDYLVRLQESSLIRSGADGRWHSATPRASEAWDCLNANEAAERRITDLRQKAARVVRAAYLCTFQAAGAPFALAERDKVTEDDSPAGESSSGFDVTFDLDKWMTEPLPSWDDTPAAIARRDGPAHGDLIARLDVLERLRIPYAKIPDGPDLALPVIDAIAMRAAQVEADLSRKRAASLERERLNAHHEDLKNQREAAARLEALTQLAYDCLDMDGHEWLSQPQPDLAGRSVLESGGVMAVEHYVALQHRLRTSGAQRAAERRDAKALDLARETLLDEAARIFGVERAEAWMRCAHHALGGQRPKDACAKPDGLARCRSLLKSSTRR